MAAHVFADGGYAGKKLRTALSKIGEWNLGIIRRSDKADGFIILPRRWVVERTFALLGRSRRLAKDWERSLESAITWLFVADNLINQRPDRPKRMIGRNTILKSDIGKQPIVRTLDTTHHKSQHFIQTNRITIKTDWREVFSATC